ncbi:MAG: hypothetical protein LBG19_09110 [Prevotellaceae bacterium]|jgi:hypothetical protein|nr:hypothetical protein [Prevotellaceae bacterium]
MKKAIILAILIACCVSIAKADQIKLKNICYVYISHKNDSIVYCYGKLIPINQLKEVLKEHITNADGHEIEAIGVGSVYRLETIIVLKTSRGTKYKTYFTVQNEISKAYNELRNELKPYQQEILRSDYPILVSDIEHRPYPTRYHQ